jgi:small subunit ribosomal protein S14
MSKESLSRRNKKRECLVLQYQSVRKSLKAKMKDKNTSLEDRIESGVKLSKLPKDSSTVRLVRRCSFTGRGRGTYRKFGDSSRHVILDLANQGLLAGVTKSSW